MAPIQINNSEGGTPYVGWTISKAERERLLALFPARYPDSYAHHVTLCHGAEARGQMAPRVSGQIIGYADDGAGVQVLVVAIDGSTVRPDGGVFHMTWSIDRGAGRRQRHSNEVLREGWVTLDRSLPIELEPVNSDGG